MVQGMSERPDIKELNRLWDLADQRLPFTNEDLDIFEAAIRFVEALPTYGVSCWMAGQSCEPCEGYIELEEALGNDVQWVKDQADQW